MASWNARPRDANGWRIAAEGTLSRKVYDLAITGKDAKTIAAELVAPFTTRLDRQNQWLRWGLEEIGRCTESKAGSGEMTYFRIGTAAAAAAAAAGVQKPTTPVVG